MLIDTHTHLYLPEFREDAEGVLAVDRALDAGVRVMLLPNVDASTVSPMKRLHSERPEATRMAIGLHPTEVNDAPLEEQLRFVSEELRNDENYIAIGEVGIDLYWDKTFRDHQMQIFEQQLRIASEQSLPVIIHCRDGLDETLEVMRGVAGLPGAIFHSFGGSVEDVEKIRRVGDFYFGINGIVTFKNSKLARVLPAIGLDRILLETDAPYLAPVPHRGKRNESSFIVHIARKVADSLGMDISDAQEATTRNAARLFRLDV